MKNKNIAKVADKHKVIIINFLYIGAMTIIFLGLFFSVFSFVNHISIKVLNAVIPGEVFGVLVLYLGIKYYLSVTKLKEELLKTSSKFTWSNFKVKKPMKLFAKR